MILLSMRPAGLRPVFFFSHSFIFCQKINKGKYIHIQVHIYMHI